MEFTAFVRKPFVIEAIELTEENLAEFAPLIGTLRTKEDGTPYIQVNWKLVPNIYRVYPGFWMTRRGDNIHCYSPKVFARQFTNITPDIQVWIDYLNDEEASVDPGDPKPEEMSA